MLACLRVRNFAIIDALEVEFGPGLNVVTGETGAGKSILVHALELVLGGRARPDVIRTGAADAEVEALFEIGADSALRVRLLEAGIDVDDELVIRRIVAANGRTRAYVGGKLTTARQLASLALGLTDICSQHEHHSLVDPSSHLGYLDAFAQNAELLSEMSVRHGALAEAQGALDALIGAGKERAEREDLLRFQLQEIDDLEPREGERSELERERQRLRHLERLGTVAGGAEEALYAEDGSICDGLSRIGEQVREACRLDPSLEGTATELEEALALVQDAAAELGRYARTLTMEPGRLEVIEERLDRLGRLERKHGGSFEALLAFAAQAREELACLEDLEGSLARAQAERDSAQEAAREAAQGLRERRKAAAGRLASSIRRELRSLGMGDAEVKVELSERGGGGAPAESRALLLDGAQLSVTGIDRCELLIAPNRGEAARPLRRVASGGELSRAMLAIKRVLGGLGPAGLYVFDEVDAGVGGAMAEIIGQKLHEVAEHHQVLCITHLAQIAAYAQTHFLVSKKRTKGRTASRIERLAEEERLGEVARMLGGVRVSEAARAAAAELIANVPSR